MKVPKARKMSSGNWYIYLRLGGRNISVTDTTETKVKHKAEMIKSQWLAEQKINEKTKENPTLKAACEEYIKHKKKLLSPTTIDGYDKIVRCAYQGLMDTPIKHITQKMLNDAVVKECHKPGRSTEYRSPKTVLNEFNFIYQILKDNGSELARPRLPEVKRKPIQILTPEQVWSAVKGSSIELPVLLAMWMTLSISEIRGLTKSKSIRNGQLSIVETVVDVDRKAIRKQEGKEETRGRTLAIPPYIQTLIDQVDGDVIWPVSSHATNKRFQTLLAKAGLPPMSFHKLRHIAASVRAMIGMPDAYIQADGGWKTDHIMKTVYTHVYSDARKMEEEKLDSYMSDIVNQNVKHTEKVQIPSQLKRFG